MRIGQKLSISLAITSIGNAVNILYRGYDFNYLLFYCFIYIPIIIVFLIMKEPVNRKRVSSVLMILSLIGFCFGGDSSLVGTTLLTDAIYISENKKAIKIYTGIAILLTIVVFTVTGQNPAQMTIYVGGSSFLFILYQHYIHPSKYKSEDSDIIQKVYNSSKVNSDVVDILQMRVRGFDWPQINDKLELNVTDQHLPRKVRDERKKLGFDTQDQFVFWLFENGIITPKKTEAEETAEKRDNL